MTSKRASTTLDEKLSFEGESSLPVSAMMSGALATTPLTTPNAEVHPKINEKQEATIVSPKTSAVPRSLAPKISGSRTGSVDTTDSSPTDPAYVPTALGIGGHFKKLAQLMKSAPGQAANPVNMASQSFFNSDTESEDEEPVIGRASSVRISKASVVGQGPGTRTKVGRIYGTTLDDNDRSVSPFGTRIIEASGELNSKNEAVSQQQDSDGPTAALRSLEGLEILQNLTKKQAADSTQPTSVDTSPPDRSKRGGLYMNPVTVQDKSSIQRAISAPPLPQKSPNRKVKIRPSDLVVGHSQYNSRLFREAVVTTPYPVLDDTEKLEEKEAAENEAPTTLPQRSGTVKSARFDNDRFPSPDRPEILFLDIGLARHPAATTTLEIKIADKSGYDDEMLFRQIRAAYRSRLLGISRLPFFLIRGVTHATVPLSVEHDFRTTEFMKHFENPRIGRRRKTWVIWLRLHSRQQSPIRGDHLSVVRRPLSASVRTADKRLSMQSDTTSTFNFSFLPPLLIPRLPFFTKDATIPSSASTYRSPPAFGSESGTGTVKVELHHEFSFWMLAFLYFWVVFTSIAAVILWTIFGVPGARPGSGKTDTPAAILMNEIAWNTGAQNRVLTGLVLGMMVGLLGSTIEICLIAGAYILL